MAITNETASKLTVAVDHMVTTVEIEITVTEIGIETGGALTKEGTIAMTFNKT